MAQVCKNCGHAHHGKLRLRCPECQAAYPATLEVAPVDEDSSPGTRPGNRGVERDSQPLSPDRVKEPGRARLVEGIGSIPSIDAYADGGRILRRSVSGMSLEQLTARPISKRWSTLEVVCHLADSEQIWCHRMKRVIAEERPLLLGYDESLFAASLGYQGRSLESELAFFEAARRQMAAILRGLPEAAWSRAGVHSERGLVTLAEMLAIETDHVLHHVRQIALKRRALGLPELDVS